MDSSRVVRLSPDLIARCERQGRMRVERYANGYNAGSRALSSHGAECNAMLQATSIMAECAFCQLIGANADTDLNWTDHSDCGYDLSFHGYTYDIKTTGWFNHYLIWPINKRHIYETEPFDRLALVKFQLPDFRIAGWISKADFLDRHQVAPADHALQAGTWFMHERDLKNPYELLCWRRYLPSIHPLFMEVTP